MTKMANKNNWRRIAILTSDYHILRCKMIWEKLADLIGSANASEVYKTEFAKALAEFKKNNREVVFVGAEKILENANSDYKVLVDEAKSSDGYKKD